MLGEFAYGIAGLYSENPGYFGQVLEYARLDRVRTQVNAAAGALIGLSLGMMVATLLNDGGQPDGPITLCTTLVGAGICLTKGFPATTDKTTEEYLAMAQKIQQEDSSSD